MSGTPPRRRRTADPTTERPAATRSAPAGASTPADLQPPKTSAAAAFALVFGLSALFSTLTVLLAPLGVALGLIAVVLGIAGLAMSNRPAITGRGVAIGGLVLGALGLLLGAAMLVGAAVWFNDPANIERVEQQLQELREELPTEVPEPN